MLKCLRTSKENRADFRCNICGKRSCFPRDELIRDIWSCRHCGSTVRWRSVIHALSMELFGASVALPDFPNRPDLAGIGLSDWDGYAKGLARSLNYTNTFFHQAPLLDITSVGPEHDGRYDFILSSDVFEHICPPVSRAFKNAYRLLKPGGFMILTVPYVDGQTREHFPGICEFSVAQEGGSWVVLGKTAEGEVKRFHEPVFHGGPGTVVECRLFGKNSLAAECQAAGFKPVRMHAETWEEFGIVWNPYIAEKAPYRPPIYGLDTPPWTLSKPE